MALHTNSALDIVRVDVWPIDIELADDFVISSGRVTTAENCFVRVTLANGVVGYGEIAPFTDITGEDRFTSFNVAKSLSTHLINQSAGTYRRFSAIMMEAEPNQPAARCGLETAILDAFCRSLGVPLWAFFGGGHLGDFETDITIPILEINRSLELVEFWYEKGFKHLKIKVGFNIHDDIEKIKRITEAHSDVSFILDANQGFTESDALRFIKEIESLGCNILLFEQPVHKNDLISMAVIRDLINIPVAADESVASAEDAQKVIAANAADVINIKIMKSSVMEAIKIATISQAAGIELMYGGMVETRLAMSCSFAIALGLSGAKALDLDTPLLLVEDPLEGGYQYDGPRMRIWSEPGLGITPVRIPAV